MRMTAQLTVTASVEYDKFRACTGIVIEIDHDGLYGYVRIPFIHATKYWPLTAQWEALFVPNPNYMRVMSPNMYAAIIINPEGDMLAFYDDDTRDNVQSSMLKLRVRASACKNAILGIMPELEAARAKLNTL